MDLTVLNAQKATKMQNNQQLQFSLGNYSQAISPKNRGKRAMILFHKRKVISKSRLLEPLKTPPTVPFKSKAQGQGIVVEGEGVRINMIPRLTAAVQINNDLESVKMLKNSQSVNQLKYPHLTSQSFNSLSQTPSNVEGFRNICSDNHSKKQLNHQSFENLLINRTLLETTSKQNRSICRQKYSTSPKPGTQDSTTCPQYSSFDSRPSKQKMIKQTLKEQKQHIPNESVLQMTTFQRYKNKVGFMEMLRSYSQLSLYERMHLDINGLTPQTGRQLNPYLQQEHRPPFENKNYSSNVYGQGFKGNSLSKELREKNLFNIYQKQQENKYDKDLPKPILDTSSFFNQGGFSLPLNLEVIHSSTKNESFSCKERKVKLQKILYLLKQQLISMVNKSTTIIPTQSQIKIMRGFLQKYLQSHEINTLTHDNYSNLYQAIIENQKFFMRDISSKSIHDIIFGIIMPNNTQQDQRNFFENVNESQLNDESKVSLNNGHKTLMNQKTSNNLKSTFMTRNHSLPNLKSSSPALDSNLHQLLAKHNLTLKQAIDKYKSSIGANFEKWCEHFARTKHLLASYSESKQKLVEQHSTQQQLHPENLSDQQESSLLEGCVSEEQRVQKDENIIPLIEREITQCLGSNTNKFRKAGMSPREREEAKSMKQLQLAGQGKTASPQAIIKDREVDIEALKRNRLMLEHVVIQRTKSLSKIAQDTIPIKHLGLASSKTLTSNIGNAPQKTMIDIDFLELQRYLKQKHALAGVQTKYNNK